MLYDINAPLPALRRDIRLTASPDGNMLYMSDAMSYAENMLTIPANALHALEMFDGHNSAFALESFFRERYAINIPASDIVEFASILDREGYLCSASFELRRREFEEKYNRETVRRNVCAGGAYPAEPEELRSFLQNIMQSADNSDIETGATGIIAPHIDLNVGGVSYAPAYHAIKDTDADLFVIYATSHYADYDLVIPTDKDFETPLGLVKTDRDLLEKIRARLPFELTRNDMAHRPEHSIELELIFLQYLFPKREFTILPLLVTSFGHYRDFPRHDEKVRLIAESVRETVKESSRKAIYISSGDLAHIGRKFGDNFDAEEKLSELAQVDAKLLDRLAICDRDGFFAQIASCNDIWKVCGTSPNYMMLETLRPKRGSVLSYDQWSEKETRSAVTFSSLSYHS